MDIFWSIFDNAISFIAMIAIMFIWPFEGKRKTLSYQLFIGFILSLMSVFIMINSVHVGNGLYIDARYAVPIIAIIFFGNIPGLMVVTTIIISRIFLLGGEGAPIGVTYVLIQAIVVLLYKRRYYRNYENDVKAASFRLLILSFFLQLSLTLLPLIFLERTSAIEAIMNNALYLLTVYPIIVFIFSLVVGYRLDYSKKVEEGKVRDKYFETMLKRSPTPIAIIDEDGKILHFNDAWSNESGYDIDDCEYFTEWLDKASDTFDRDKTAGFNVGEVKSDEISTFDYYLRTDKKKQKVWSIDCKNAGELPDGKKFYIYIAKDITNHKSYEKKLLKMSYHDFLTGLYNRRYFDEVFSSKHNHNNETFLLYGDMNNLKSLNDYYGHSKGDKAIKYVSSVLANVFNENATIFRFGGDEFLIITDNLSKDNCLENILEIDGRLKGFSIGEVEISISLGLHKLEENESLESAIMKAESRMYEYKIFESTSARSDTIDVILTMLFEKDEETERHSKRVRDICREFNKVLDLDSQESSLLLRSSLLHDIGKILIPTSILLSKEKLSEGEYTVIKNHSFLGYRILSSKEHFKTISEIVLSHHERVDGTGYPNQLKGEEIPFVARILNIVDAFEAMTSDRPYSSKKTYEEARLELIACSGTQFDKNLVDKFVTIIDEIPEY